MLRAICNIPRYYSFRKLGWPLSLPMNLTLSVTYRCNSRCKTCNIYTKTVREFSLDEWRMTFQSLGHAPFWVTISGGEPFLRGDLPQIVRSLYDLCRPSIINIPTNALLKDRIVDGVREIARHCTRAKIVVNVSLDGIGPCHDEIRGVRGNYDSVLETFRELKRLDISNLSLGIHTVISRFNVCMVPEIYKHVRSLGPDSYVTEIAEERVELGTMGAEITPRYEEYVTAVDMLSELQSKDHFPSVGRITRAFRADYHRIVKRILRERCQVIPCYAGFASAQIAPDGDLWGCCVRAESVGNLRDVAYDFREIWFSPKALELRESVKRGDCCCPLANASYTNMLHHLRTLARVTWNLVGMK